MLAPAATMASPARVARIGECGVGQREEHAPMADAVAVQHVRPHRHRQSDNARRDLHHFDAERSEPRYRPRTALVHRQRDVTAGRVGHPQRPLKARRALFGECGDTFGVVGRTAEFALHIPLDIELFGEGALPAAANGRSWLPPARASERPPTAVRAHRRSRRIRRRPRTARSFPRQPLVRREVSRRATSSRVHAHCRPAAADVHVPPESGTSPSLRERLNEARRSRGDHQIAGERDIGAGARGHAVDRRDDRHRQMLQRQHQRLVVLLDRVAEIEPSARPAPRRDRRDPGRRKSRARRRSEPIRGHRRGISFPSACRTSSCICVLKLLSLSGRFSVRRATPRSTSNRMVSYDMAAPREHSSSIYFSS